ncbi:MAG TPA: DMT family transporter, partial [Myxococcota bacterium]|nr:DMT family transporter [Myxococcota bacterium]
VASWAYLSVRTLGRLGEPDWRVVFWFGAVGSVLGGAWQLAAGGFHPVGWHNAWILAGLGLSGFLAQLALTRAYRTGNTLVVGAFSYSAIVFATIATIVVWDERLGALEWAGMAVIVAGGIIAMRVERKEKIQEGGFDN